MKKISLFLIEFYRKYLSRLKLGPTCRFYPTCSAYTAKAIEEWGVVRGAFLGIYRVLRCNPFCRAGIDLVPKKRKKTVPGTAERRAEKAVTPFYTTDIFYFEGQLYISGLKQKGTHISAGRLNLN